MADFTEQERADLQRQVMEEMRQYGRLHTSTADDLRDAQVGVKGFSKQVRTSAVDVTKAYSDLTKQIYSGAQGMSVFNNAVETTATAVAAFGFLMGGPIVKAVSVALVGLAKTLGLAAESSDRIYNAYSKLAEVGGTASDQLSGLRDESARLGYIIADNNEGLNAFTSLIADNADTLALFKGTVFEGRHALANVSTQLDDYRMGLRKMGLTQDQQNKGMVAYIRLQTTLGQAQQKTYTDLAAGTNKYLQETQALASITGQQRKEVEAEMQRALTEQKFRAKIDELYATGQGKLAEEYQAINVMLAKQSPEAASGFRAMVGGSLEAADSQKLLRSSSGQVVSSLDALNKGQINGAQFVTELGKSVGATNRTFNKTAQLTSAFGETFIDYAQGQNLAILANRDLNKEYQKALKQGKEQRENTEKELEDQVETRQNQLDAARNMQEFVRKFVSMAGTITNGLSDLWKTMSGWLTKFANTFGEIIDYIKYDILKMARPEQAAAERAAAGPGPSMNREINEQQYKYWKDVSKYNPNVVPEWAKKLMDEEKRTGKNPYENLPPPAKPGGAAPAAGQSGALDSSRMQSYLKGVALAESSGNRMAGAGTSSAKGLFQFTKDTWQDTVKAMGKNWSLEDRHDPIKSAEAAAFFTRGNAAVFEKEFGRTPTNEELYMMHFFGRTGGPAFYKNYLKNPYAKVSKESIGEDAWKANQSIFVDKAGQRVRTFDEVYNILAGKVSRGMAGAESGMWGKYAINQDVANIPQLNRGGIVSGPDSGFLANLHGREAVVPLPDGSSIPVAFNPQEFIRSLSEAGRSSSVSGTGDLVGSIQDLVRLQRDNNDLLSKMLQYQRA